MDDVSEVAVYTDRPAANVTTTERAPTREEMSELLSLVASAAYPVKGRVKALAHVVRVLRHCPWVSGTLRVELTRAGHESDEVTSVHLLADDAGRRERLLPSVTLDVSLAQLRLAIRANPEVFARLRACSDDDDDGVDLVALAVPS